DRRDRGPDPGPARHRAADRRAGVPPPPGEERGGAARRRRLEGARPPPVAAVDRVRRGPAANGRVDADVDRALQALDLLRLARPPDEYERFDPTAGGLA